MSYQSELSEYGVIITCRGWRVLTERDKQREIERLNSASKRFEESLRPSEELCKGIYGTGWLVLTPEQKEEFKKTELEKYEAFDRKYEQSLRVSEESFNRPITI